MSKEFPSFEQTLKKSLESKNQPTIHVLESSIDKLYESSDFDIVKKFRAEGEHLPYVNNAEGQVSAVSDKPKYTDGLVNCTGIAVSGIEKNTGKTISFISHSPAPDDFDIFQSYDARLYEEETGRKQHDSVKSFEQYEAVLQQRMNELSERCEEGSFSATIAGGAIPKEYEKGGILAWKTPEEVAQEYPIRKEGYERSVDALQAVVASCLGIDAQVIDPVTFIPKAFMGTEMYLDTEHHDLYIRYANN